MLCTCLLGKGWFVLMVLVSTVFFVCFWWLAYRFWEVCIFYIGAYLAGVWLLAALVFLPLERAECRSAIERYDAVRLTIERSRQAGREYETAALVRELVQVNQGLASARYWNESLWTDWYIVDEYAALEPLR